MKNINKNIKYALLCAVLKSAAMMQEGGASKPADSAATVPVAGAARAASVRHEYAKLRDL